MPSYTYIPPSTGSGSSAPIYQPLPITEGQVDTNQVIVGDSITQILGATQGLATVLVQVTLASVTGIEILQNSNSKIGTGFQIQPGQSVALEYYTGSLYAVSLNSADVADVRILTNYVI